MALVCFSGFLALGDEYFTWWCVQKDHNREGLYQAETKWIPTTSTVEDEINVPIALSAFRDKLQILIHYLYTFH